MKRIKVDLWLWTDSDRQQQPQKLVANIDPK